MHGIDLVNGRKKKGVFTLRINTFFWVNALLV